MGDTVKDHDIQWHAIQALRPVSSLVKFAVPNIRDQYFDYVPGEILIQIFCFYSTLETRLMIEGVPEAMKRYNAWNMYEKMNFHHEHMRGQVYEPSRGTCCTKVLDHCFDCSVLWETISTYAAKNNADAHSLLNNLIKYQVYTPPGFAWKNGGVAVS